MRKFFRRLWLVIRLCIFAYLLYVIALRLTAINPFFYEYVATHTLIDPDDVPHMNGVLSCARIMTFIIGFFYAMTVMAVLVTAVIFALKETTPQHRWTAFIKKNISCIIKAIEFLMVCYWFVLIALPPWVLYEQNLHFLDQVRNLRH